MTDFLMDIRQLADQDTATTVITIFTQSVLEEGKVKVSAANQFFQSCLNNFESPSVTPRTKYLTLYMLKELSLQKVVTKIFGHFSRHPLYNYLEQTALKTDPRKPVEEKGKNFFPGDKKTGNQFIRLLLQSLLTWGTRFGSNKSKPTRFTATLQNISDARLVVPKEYIHYQKKGAETPSGGGQSKREVSKKENTPAPTVTSTASTAKKHAAQIRYMFDKIDSLIGVFDEIDDDIDELQREVNSYHHKFQLDFKKIEQNQTAMIDGQEDQIVDLFFKVSGFFVQESQLYNLHVRNNDYTTYMNGYRIAFEQIFPQMSKRENNPKPSLPPKQETSIDAKMAEKSKTKESLPPPSKSSFGKQSIKKESPESIKKPPSKTHDRQNRYMERGGGQAEKVLDNFISKIEKRSKSPLGQFNNVAKSLSKSKLNTVAVSKKRNPMAVSQFNKSKFGASSSVSKSTVQLKGIFAAPPNPYIKNRKYQGQIVKQYYEFNLLSQSILSAQGYRRFKASHFKSKYILFEDDRIQIGFKVSQIYEKVDKYSSLMLFQLFFGNKTSSMISRFKLQFQGDKNSLIYTNPQVIQDRILPEAQNKLELLNVPKQVPFGHISMHISYSYDGDLHHISNYLPNSILQMCSYFDLSPGKYATDWADSAKILSTQSFKLSHHFAPNQLKNHIPSLQENTRYSDFERQGSSTDYQLYTQVIIQESYEGILKIIIRPDLSVVLQLGMYELEENSLKNFKFFLQSLQMVLKSQI